MTNLNAALEIAASFISLQAQRAALCETIGAAMANLGYALQKFAHAELPTQGFGPNEAGAFTYMASATRTLTETELTHSDAAAAFMVARALPCVRAGVPYRFASELAVACLERGILAPSRVDAFSALAGLLDVRGYERISWGNEEKREMRALGISG